MEHNYQNDQQQRALSKYFIIEPIPTPVMIAQIEDQTKYKFPITIVPLALVPLAQAPILGQKFVSVVPLAQAPILGQKFVSVVQEPANDILIRITPYKSDYCLN